MPTHAPGRFRTLAPLAALCTLAAACSPFEFEAQELVLRHDSEGDSLELGIVYEGLSCGDQGNDPLAVSVEAMQRIVAGDRYFMLLAWPFLFDFDRPRVESDPEELPTEWEVRAQDLMRSLEVTEAVLFEDEQGRLGAVQRLRLENASKSIATLNAWLNVVVIESLKENAEEDGDLDGRTRDLMLAHARSGKPWILLVRGGFEVRVPLSRALAARQLAALATPPDEHSLQDRGVAADLLASLSEISFADELLVLRFLPDEEGRVVFRFHLPDSPYDERLRRALQDGDVGVPAHTLAWARERARGQ
ncbi:MAG: hypothetical protein V3T22_14395 [Planctomycetota bacterium]